MEEESTGRIRAEIRSSRCNKSRSNATYWSTFITI